MPVMRAISEYVAPKVMEDLRKHRAIDENLARELSRTPFIDDLRSEVQPADRELVVALINSSVQQVAFLGLDLVVNIKHGQGIRDILFDAWHRTGDPLLKVKLTFRLADFEDLDLAEHRELYGFIRAHWGQWIAQVASFFESGDVLAQIEERISSGRFPASKRWLHLCQACAAGDSEGVADFIERHRDSELPLVSEVADDLTERFRNLAQDEKPGL